DKMGTSVQDLHIYQFSIRPWKKIFSSSMILPTTGNAHTLVASVTNVLKSTVAAFMRALVD
ncbi:hypothetical protein, partial [Salmonella sp. s51090]|uniref:hypothetical protein n=1 Tax=Salmonella sp. s51090 TaxID=3159651 RepID=UPI00397EC15C